MAGGTGDSVERLGEIAPIAIRVGTIAAADARVVVAASRPYPEAMSGQGARRSARWWSGRARRRLALAALLLADWGAAHAVAPAALWSGQAHFVQVGELAWQSLPDPDASEGDGWYVVRDGVWYAFNRVTPRTPVGYCHQDHLRVVVRRSRDHGRTWSAPVTAVEPGASGDADGCAVVDGSTYYDRAGDTWHLLAQCLARESAGGWSLCHYSRRGATPMGRFVPDGANPVVHAGDLWSRICGGGGKSCPVSTRDEGTPDIVEKRDGRYIVTFHGFDYPSRASFRGVAATRDFRHWQVAGADLPGDAILGPADCRAWLAGCAGVGEATTLLMPEAAYTVVETMTGSALCTTGQRWVFQLLRTSRGRWPRSGTRGWQRLADRPLLVPSAPDPGTPCQVSYARWLVDGSHLYLIYQDVAPGRAVTHRRVLELVPGGGPSVRIR